MIKKLFFIPLVLALCGQAFGAAFTSTQDGDWNDGGTWGNTSPGIDGTDYPSSSGGDTFTLSAGDEVTVPAGYNAVSSGTLSDGSGADPTKLIIVGTLDLGGNIVLNDEVFLVLSAGATLDLNGNDITMLVDNDDIDLLFDGTSGSHVTVQSTTTAGEFLPTDFSRVNISATYTDFNNLDNGILGGATRDTDDQVFSRCTFVDCGDLQIGSYDVNSASDITLDNCDFRNCDGSNGYILYLKLASGTGTRGVTNCTFYDSGSATIRLQADQISFTDNVLSNVVLQSTIFDEMTISGNFITHATDNVPVIVRHDSTFTGNYIYTPVDNPHTIRVDTATNVKTIISNNVIEADYLSYTDAGDHIIAPDIDLDIYGNIIIDDKGGVLLNATNDRSADYNVYRNTLMADINIYGSLVRNESGSTFTGGTLAAYDNILFDSDTSSAGRGINMETAGIDQIDYADYGCFYGNPSGDVADHYYQVTITSKNEGVDAGFAASDIITDPMFIDKDRRLAEWDDVLADGVDDDDGTASSAVTEMLQLNGYGGTFDSNYSVADLLAWVRAGFVPTNAALDGAGRYGDDIGAMDYAPASTGSPAAMLMGF